MLKITIATLIILGLDLSWWWLIAVYASWIVDALFSGRDAQTEYKNFVAVIANQHSTDKRIQDAYFSLKKKIEELK